MVWRSAILEVDPAAAYCFLLSVSLHCCHSSFHKFTIVSNVLLLLRLISFQDEEDTDLYDVVTEDQYKSIVKGRLQKDDFVEDDGVEGYMDNGMDDWTGGDSQEEEEYEKRPCASVSLP